MPQRQGEGQSDYRTRVRNKLRTIYRRCGYELIKGFIMARSVEPQHADPGDTLLEVPDPAPAAPDADTSSTTIDRSEDPEMQELEDTGDYIPL